MAITNEKLRDVEDKIECPTEITDEFPIDGTERIRERKYFFNGLEFSRANTRYKISYS